MYGLMHQALIRWIKTLDRGEEILTRIFKQLNIQGRPDDFFRHYTDAQTFTFLELVAKETGYPLDECKFQAGAVSTFTFVDNGYQQVMHTLGGDFYTMLTNLDSLHDNFLSAFPEMKVPYVRPERNPDGSMSIHYYSQRRGLAPFMMGALKCAAKQLYDLEIDIHHRSKRGMNDNDHDIFHVFMDQKGFPDAPLEVEDDAKMARAHLSTKMTSRLFPWHIAFDRDMRITSLGKHLAARMKKDCIGAPATKLFHIVQPVDAKWDFDDFKQREGKPFLFATKPHRMLSAEEYANLLSEQRKRQQEMTATMMASMASGQGPCPVQHLDLRKLVLKDGDESSSVASGPHTDTHSEASRGQDELASELGEEDGEDDGASEVSKTFSAGCPFSGFTSAATSASASRRTSMERIERRARYMRKPTRIKLHGEVVYDEETDTILFAGNPLVQSQEELEAQGIDLSDLPIHSHGREVLYGSMFQATSASNSNDVEAKLAELDESMTKINKTKEKVDSLLQSILPTSVADSLARGEVPPVETYEQVTVLFSDIVGFTNISSEVPSLEVMDMLHELFVKFDDLAEKHGCYKVETIGDAYMVAAGCPDECDDHALRIARMAIDMVRAASGVTSPLDGEPLRIRVGIHSGPVKAGVVGRARPRYCLFGDTVNVASRMESNGVPGCIQATYRFLRSLPAHSDINIVPRGHINVKGKGRVKAFLVLGCTSMPGELLLPDAEESGDMGKEIGMLRMQCQMQQAMHGSAHSSSSRDGSISPQMRYSTSGFNSTPTSSLHLNRAGLSAFELKNYM